MFIAEDKISFLNYVTQYKDIYVLKKRYEKEFSSEIVKSFNNLLIVKKSLPKNALTIESVNGKDISSSVTNG